MNIIRTSKGLLRVSVKLLKKTVQFSHTLKDYYYRLLQKQGRERVASSKGSNLWVRLGRFEKAEGQTNRTNKKTHKKRGREGKVRKG